MGDSLQDRFEVKVVIGDVNSDDAARRHMAFVEFKGFASEQVNGDGIAVESIQNEQVEVLRRFALEGEARVSGADLDLGWRLLKVSEFGDRKRGDLVIDFIEAEAVAEFAIGSHGAGAETDNAYVVRKCSKRGEAESNTAPLNIVGGGPAGWRGVHKLQAVSNPAVLEELIVAERVVRVVVQEFQNAIKGAGTHQGGWGIGAGV